LLITVTIPAAFPGILSGAKLGWTFALRSLMAGELLFVSGGLGQLLETGRDLGDTALVLAIVAVVVALGRMSEWLLFARLDRAVARRWGTEVTA
jgi:NitT/TauT family transport system permease protein